MISIIQFKSMIDMSQVTRARIASKGKENRIYILFIFTSQHQLICNFNGLTRHVVGAFLSEQTRTVWIYLCIIKVILVQLLLDLGFTPKIAPITSTAG